MNVGVHNVLRFLVDSITDRTYIRQLTFSVDQRGCFPPLRRVGTLWCYGWVEIRIVALSPAEFRLRVREALDVYVSAMGYSPRLSWQRSPVWHEHSRWAGFSAVAAFASREDAAGLAVSSSADGAAARGRGRRWWFRRAHHEPASESQDLDVRVVPASGDTRGLAGQAPPSSDEVLVGICYGYRTSQGQWWFDRVSAGARSAGVSLPEIMAELTELHVLPALHGHRVGRALLQSFLATRTEGSVLLSTPEVEGETNNAWRLYRRAGFTDVLRNFLFEGDPRRFAILRTDLHQMSATSTAAGSRTE